MSEREIKENAPTMARYGGDPETKKSAHSGRWWLNAVLQLSDHFRQAQIFSFPFTVSLAVKQIRERKV
ncbi:hypothetical protein WAJ64_21935 [Acinetobacter baumannii]